ncbi:hypothetical protein [Microbacterium sp. Leaf159]|uniref:hypothetical protein n=1 Tax=Microbacterium sp. Leaf159 TaxID=1736279 RepID=UPI0006FB49F3|nr:hypothetical protein [Microbacterium sp. Leaf159]KQR39205.1 hypothetical protein ASF80_07195 [Microbacterium sp. Leaf159]
MPEWLSNLDWGDVPSWLGVLLGVAVPLIAYFERNRIAGFFRKKAQEPVPLDPPARFAVRPIAENGWALVNTGIGEAFNVTLSVDDASAGILSSGFWTFFPGQSYGSFALQYSNSTIRYPDVSDTTVIVEWQDRTSNAHSEVMTASHPSRYASSPLSWPRTDEGKIRSIAELEPTRDPEG